MDKNMSGAGQLPEKFIVIGGIPRSGKNLIREILNAHSDISIPGSAMAFFNYFDETTYAGRGGFQENLEYYFNDCRKSKSWDIKQGQVRGSGESRADLYRVLLETYRDVHGSGKKYYGEFTHVAENYFDEYVDLVGLERLKFIQIIRNPYENYVSFYKNRKVTDKERPDFVNYFCNIWSQSTVAGLYLSAKYPVSCQTYFFDDIKRDHTKFISDLCGWVGVGDETPSILEQVEFKYKQNNSKHEEELLDIEKATLNSMASPHLMQNLGFKPKHYSYHIKDRQIENGKAFSDMTKLMLASHMEQLSPLQFIQTSLSINWFLCVAMLKKTLKAVFYKLKR